MCGCRIVAEAIVPVGAKVAVLKVAVDAIEVDAAVEVVAPVEVPKVESAPTVQAAYRR